MGLLAAPPYLKPGEELPGETMHLPTIRRNILSIKDRYVTVDDTKESSPVSGIYRYPAIPREMLR